MKIRRQMNGKTSPGKAIRCAYMFSSRETNWKDEKCPEKESYTSFMHVYVYI